jgi:hypothetical protein
VKPPQYAFTSRFLVTDLNNGDSSTSMFMSLLPVEYPITALNKISLHRLTHNWSKSSKANSSQSHIATDGQSISKSWYRAHYCFTVMVLFLWDALSDNTTGMSFVYVASPCQRSHFRVQVPWDPRHILLSQIWDFFLVASYNLQGHGGGIRLRLHTGVLQLSSL